MIGLLLLIFSIFLVVLRFVLKVAYAAVCWNKEH